MNEYFMMLCKENDEIRLRVKADTVIEAIDQFFANSLTRKLFNEQRGALTIILARSEADEK